jgi:hypothetical protein
LPWAVLIRGANVGGKTFRPSALVAALPDLDLVSIGAAGTFAARSGRTAERVRSGIAGELPFDAEIVVLPAKTLRQLLESDPLEKVSLAPGERRYLTVATRPVPATPAPPLYFPDKPHWQVQVLTIDGPFVAGIRRRFGPRLIYPNEVVEKTFKVSATTRWWETIESLDRSFPNAA